MVQPDGLATCVEILKGFGSAMLVTHMGNGRLRARPMMIADIEEESGNLWFITDRHTGKVEEIEANSQVLVTCQEERGNYIALSGIGRVVQDQSRVDDLWKEPFRVWFPEGKEDPRIVLIHVRTDQAEYWDRSGTNRVEYLFEAAKAYATGRQPDLDQEHYGRFNKI